MFRRILTVAFVSVTLTVTLLGLPCLVSGQSPEEKAGELQREPETKTLAQEFEEWKKKQEAHKEQEAKTQREASAEEDFAAIKKDPKRLKQTIAMIQMALGALGYGVGPFDGTMTPQTQKALEAYQEKKHLAATGTLTAETVVKLFEDGLLTRNHIAGLPPRHVFVDLWEDGFVSARGTWMIDDELMGQPVQTTELNCYKDRRMCIDATAIMTDGDFLSLDTTLYDIERWDQHEITTKPYNFICVRYTLRIGRIEQSVTALRLKTRSDGTCKAIRQEMHLTLKDGLDATAQLKKETAAKLRDVLLAPGLYDVMKDLP